ncbi:DNA primase [Roseobacter phage RDJL Phi 1]|uniref:Integrase n=1 Tax=Roseobacter phage RDJL Phi 1 TaxID=562742 RepID=F4YXQ8_9CAUD|nr:DNA primase [Roseobacter phage RDJL Phi 1]ADK73448.1 integrase [Roseobacter phage RDJL Phi 1]
MDPKTDPGQLKPYLAAGMQLIPLHHHTDEDEYKGKKRNRGKSPVDKNWMKRTYKSDLQVDYMEEGYNVGVRLGAGDLVLDIDPRGFPEGETLATDNPFKRLCKDVGLNVDEFPRVETGSGGLHIYMSKPEDVSTRDSLNDQYPGVEFKSFGRQVVSAGSIHPDTKLPYSWDFLYPELDELGTPSAPKLLIDLIRRPTGSAATGGGEHDQEELAEMLDQLDPEDFSDHDSWLTLMQACHHATAGDGRQEFIEWCTRDPEYSDHGTIIGLRWDSLHADADGARVTYRTLHKFMRDKGAGELIPRTPAADDFDDLDPDDVPDEAFDEETPEHEKKGPLEKMNDRYCAVMDGGKFRVMWEVLDPDSGDAKEGIAPRKCWVSATKFDFQSFLANRRVQQGDRAVPIAEAWQEWGGRRQYNGVIFDPERDHKGFLNLWTGWAVTPAKKDDGWSYLNELLSDVLCDGDEAVYEYVMNWAAYMIQHPGSPAEVAICFQGGKGVGKGTWFRTLAQLAGRHGMQITSSEHLTGRFNDHLRDCIFLFADEAIKAYDKDGESRLKGLITEPTLVYEGKGKDAKRGKNRLHVGMASNEDWFIPMGLEGERRFLLQRANQNKVGQHSWFEKLNDQLNQGGREALLWDLMQRDISGWAPRKQIPTSAAAIEQKIMGMGPIEQWWFDLLYQGNLDFDPCDEQSKWVEGPVRVFREDIQESYENHCRRNGIRPNSMGRGIDMMFTKNIKNLCPGIKDKQKARPMEGSVLKRLGDGRAWAYDLPRLEECRESFTRFFGDSYNWPNVDEQLHEPAEFPDDL